MKTFRVDATIIVTLEQVRLHGEVSFTSNDTVNEELQDLLLQKLERKLKIIDGEGKVTVNEGLITSLDCESMDHWEVTEGKQT